MKKTIIAFVAIIIIVIALVIIFIPKNKNDKDTVDGIKIVHIEKEVELDTTKKQAIEATIEQFKRLGEDVQEADLKLDIIEKNGDSYYFIKSPQNSIQIQINTGKIVRINSISI